MRRMTKAFIVSVLMILGIVGVAQATVFDGTNHNPEYTEGITEVYAVTDNGIPVYVPVWSMERCMHEDGSGQVACVWHSPTQGNRAGAVSFMKLGGNEFAIISHEAARILLAENSGIQVNYTPENVEVAPNVVEFDGSLPTNNNVNSYTQGYPPCQFEDSVGCYWNAQTMGNGNGSSFVVDVYGNYDFFPGKAQIATVDETFASAECDVKCQEDMANDFVTDESNDVIDTSSDNLEFTQSELDAMNGVG